MHGLVPTWSGLLRIGRPFRAEWGECHADQCQGVFSRKFRIGVEQFVEQGHVLPMQYAAVTCTAALFSRIICREREYLDLDYSTCL